MCMDDELMNFGWVGVAHWMGCGGGYEPLELTPLTMTMLSSLDPTMPFCWMTRIIPRTVAFDMFVSKHWCFWWAVTFFISSSYDWM